MYKFVQIEKNIQYTAGQTVFEEEMEQMKNVQARIILLYARYLHLKIH